MRGVIGIVPLIDYLLKVRRNSSFSKGRRGSIYRIGYSLV